MPGTNFAANENSDGKTVIGSYTVHLPDGRVQTVSYTADHYNGYIADVKVSQLRFYSFLLTLNLQSKIIETNNGIYLLSTGSYAAFKPLMGLKGDGGGSEVVPQFYFSFDRKNFMWVIFFLGATYLGRVVVPSPKIV